MKKTLLACCFAYFGLMAFADTTLAQTAKVVWGPALKEPKKTATTKIIGSDKNGFYTLRTGGYSMFNRVGDSKFLERYDNQNKLVYSKEISIPVPEKPKQKFQFENIYYLNGGLIMFTSHLNKDKRSMYASHISPDGVVDNRLVEVSSISESAKRSSGTFETRLSNDSTKILIFANLPYEKNENEKFEFKVIDNHLQTVSTKALTLPQRDKDVTISNYRVDNEGNVYVMLSTDKSRAEKNRKEQKFTYKVLGYFHKENLTKEYEVAIPNKFITDITFDIDKNQNLVVAGFYAVDKKLKTEGTFFLKVDFETKKVLTQGVKQFGTEFMEMFMSKSKAKSANAGVANMSLDKLIIREDGGALLVAEQAYMYITEINNGRHRSKVYHYVNNDIIFVNINPDGSVQWISRVPKKQHTTNDGAMYSSYSISVMQDKLYLIYNDHAKNIAISEPRKLKQMNKPHKAVTMLVAMDNRGQFTKTALFPAREHKSIVRPSFYLQNNNNVIIYSETERNYRFGNINFN